MLYKTSGPFRPGRFVFSALLIDDTNVFFDGCHPLSLGLQVLWTPFFVMGALPGPNSVYRAGSTLSTPPIDISLSTLYHKLE